MLKHIEDNKSIFIRNLRCAGRLMDKGFVLHSTMKNEDGSKNIYVFTNSREIVAAANEILIQLKRERG